jgi:hypothetical protein
VDADDVSAGLGKVCHAQLGLDNHLQQPTNKCSSWRCVSEVWCRRVGQHGVAPDG